jgi:branched-chain amino acid transport system ATP-binding protein
VTLRLALEHADAGYGAVDVLHDISLAFPAGHVVALLGRNGAGKSSTLAALAGTLPLRAGRVVLDGRDITRVTPHGRVRLGITTVPDEPNVFGGLTVADNLALFAGHAPLDLAYNTFPELAPLRDRRAGSLSGGERQMLALCRMVLHPSPVVLLDEVSRGLAPAVVGRLYDVIAMLRAPHRTIVAVEQHREELLAIADLVYVLRRGEVAWAGTPRELAPV